MPWHSPGPGAAGPLLRGQAAPTSRPSPRVLLVGALGGPQPPLPTAGLWGLNAKGCFVGLCTEAVRRRRFSRRCLTLQRRGWLQEADRRQRILVVGGGVGGFNLALRLAEMPWTQRGSCKPPHIHFVDPKDRFVFTPLLVDYAISQDVELDEFAPTYADLLRAAKQERAAIPGSGAGEVEHVQGRITRVDWRRRVATLLRDGEEDRADFDILVIAPGQLARQQGCLEFPSDSPSVLPFASLADGSRLREAMARGPPQTVAVVGAGYVGVEVAAALAECGGCRVSLFGGTLLQGAEPMNRRRAETRLQALGVMRRQGRVVAAAEGGLDWQPQGGAAAGGGLQRHACDLVLVTGAAATPSAECVVEPASAAHSPVGRLGVDEYLRIAPGVFCIGDAAVAGSQPTGQAAMQQAEVAAWNVFAQSTGLPRAAWRKYSPSALGEFVVLGSREAAAVVAPARLTKLLPPALPPTMAAAVSPLIAAASSIGDAQLDFGGLPAALLRRLSYLYRMPTLGHRAWVAQRWATRAQEKGVALPH